MCTDARMGILGAGLWGRGARTCERRRQALAVLGRRGRSTTQNMYMSCEINFSGRVSLSLRNEMEMQNIGISTMRYLERMV